MVLNVFVECQLTCIYTEILIIKLKDQQFRSEGEA